MLSAVRRPAIFLSLAAVFLNGLSVVRGQTPKQTRPRIGLALAGGGAKGLAHVGVLRWLEENHIPVDAIAGTSMGGLVAGMYATGRNSAEIQKFVDAIEWDVVLSRRPEYTNLNIRRKEDQQSFPATLELGMPKGELRLPTSLNTSHRIQFLIDQIGFAYPEMRSFDDLPTPFRCVAADLLSGKKIVFEDNSLSHALRATMSLPAFFDPVPHNGMLLVDGGIVDNLPADIVRGMNAQIVIAVDLGFETIDKDRSFSLLTVAGRSIDIMIRNNVSESLRSADVVVSPKVLDFSTLGFRDVKQIIERGYAAAQSMGDELRKYAATEEQWRAHLEARQRKIRDPQLTPKFVEVSGSLSQDERSMKARLEGFAGKPFDRSNIENGLTEIAGLGPYDSIVYGQTERSGERGLDFELRRKSYGPPFVRPLLILDSGQAGTASFTLAARITHFQFPTLRSEWRTDASLGRIKSIGSEYYQFLGPGGLFVAPRGFVSQEQQLLVNHGQRLAEYEVNRAGGGFDIGYNFGRLSELRTGIELARLRGSVEIGFPVLPNARGTEKIWMSRWSFNAVNRGTIPTRGVAIESQLNWQFGSPRLYFADQDVTKEGDFGQAWSQIVYARPFNPKWSGLLRVLGGGTFNGEAQPFSDFRLGGPFRLGALVPGELRGNHVAYGSAGVLRLLYDSPTSFMGRLYGMVLYETGDAFNSRANLFHGGTAGIAAETNIGTLTTGFSYGEGGRHGFFFSIGRIFDVGLRGGSLLR